MKILLERLKKYCSHLERGFLVFWQGFSEGAGLKNPVTEPKRSQNPKRPLLSHPFPNGYSIFENAPGSFPPKRTSLSEAYLLILISIAVNTWSRPFDRTGVRWFNVSRPKR
jgi:hypothetical protein